MKRSSAPWPFWLVAVLCCGPPGGCVSPDHPGDGGTDGDATGSCSGDPDCDDGVFCNGPERCDPTLPGADARGCAPGASPCLAGQDCDETARRCVTDCAVSPDADGDGADAIECGGHDCDDGDSRRFPSNVEQCDQVGLDEDCNPATLGHDADGDGSVSDQCCNRQLDGSLSCGTDCDDGAIGINPGAPEVCDEHPDNDCDGSRPFDGDADGYDTDDCGGPDCDDDDPDINPAREETCGNHTDEDCDGFANDRDCDGHDDAAHAVEGCSDCDDCDDDDPEIHPGATERCNALDDDCDGRVPEAEDRDHDGYHGCTDGPDERRDCDDEDPDRHPGNPEICGDGVDQDCDGAVDGRPCWIVVLAGSFVMGSPAGELGRLADEVQHEVTLTHDFFLLSTEVTQRHFSALMGYDPSYFTDSPDLPVETVTWHEAEAFCNALSDAEGLDRCYECTGSEVDVDCEALFATPYECPGYRLPTEAEWEFAARAGTTTATYHGDLDVDLLFPCDPSAVLDSIAWWCGNSGGTTHAVGTLEPNAWGLHDMLGNVFEWVYELYGDYPSGTVMDPPGPSEGTSRMSRGGSFGMEADLIRAAVRTSLLVSPPIPSRPGTGFRPVRSLP